METSQNRIYINLLILCGFIFSTRWVSANEVKVKFECPQTNIEQRVLPQNASLSVKTLANSDGTFKSLDLSSLESFIEKGWHASTDYYRCFYQMIGDLDAKVSKLCGSFAAPAEAAKCKKASDSNIDRFDKKVRNIDPNGKVAPLIIGENYQGQDSKILKVEEEGCLDVSKLNLTEPFLSSGLAPALAKETGDCREFQLRRIANMLEDQIVVHCSKAEKSEACQRAIVGVVYTISTLGPSLQFNPRGEVNAALICNTDVKGIRDLVEELRLARECQDLSLGESRVFHTHSGSYGLTRVGDGKFIADIKIKITNDLGAAVTGEMRDSLLDRIKKTVDIINPYLKGSNGDSLQIRINSDKAPMGLEATPINIAKTLDSRDHSKVYSLDSVEPVISHELLHNMGLNDGYEEKSRGEIWNLKDPNTRKPIDEIKNYHLKPGEIFKPAYDCRAIEPKDSIMNDQIQAWAKAIPIVVQELLICDSPDKSQDLSKCRKQQGESRFLFGRTTEKDENLEFQEISPGRWWVATLKYKIKPERDSLLYPAQFRKLIKPNCKKYVGDFYDCSRFAYISSKDNYSFCPRKMPQCQGTGWLK